MYKKKELESEIMYSQCTPKLQYPGNSVSTFILINNETLISKKIVEFGSHTIIFHKST